MNKLYHIGPQDFEIFAKRREQSLTDVPVLPESGALPIALEASVNVVININISK